MLLVLTAILIEPGLAAPIVDYISRIIRLVLAFIQGFGQLDFAALETRYRAIELPFDGSNPYGLLIAVLIGFVLISYSMRSNTEGVTSFSRILGGLLGLFNGFLVISLFRQYVLKYFQKADPALWAAAGPSPEVSVTVQGVPTGDLLTGERWQIIVVLLGLMVALLFISMVAGQPIGKK